MVHDFFRLHPVALRRLAIAGVIAVTGGLMYAPGAWVVNSGFSLSEVYARISALATVYLAILVEGLPFLLLGVLAAGLVEVFLAPGELARIIPKQPLLGALAGSLLGIFFPVSGVGIVPLARRMIRAGLPVPAGAAFMLAAPVINPISVVVALVAFGAGSPIFWGLVGLVVATGAAAGWMFSLHEAPQQLLLLIDGEAGAGEALSGPETSLRARLRRAVEIAADDFLEFGAWLAGGALVAALVQGLVPQGWLLGLGRSPLSISASSLAFGVLYSSGAVAGPSMASAMRGVFPGGVLLAYLAAAPALALPNLALWLRVLRTKAALYLAVLPLALYTLAGLIFYLASY